MLKTAQSINSSDTASNWNLLELKVSERVGVRINLSIVYQGGGNSLSVHRRETYLGHKGVSLAKVQLNDNHSGG